MVDIEKENKAQSLNFIITSTLERMGELCQMVCDHPATPSLLMQISDMVKDLRALKEELMEERMKELEALEADDYATSLEEEEEVEEFSISSEVDTENKRVVSTVTNSKGEPVSSKLLAVSIPNKSTTFVITDDAGQAVCSNSFNNGIEISLVEEAKSSNSSDYLVVEDKDKSSTWHLQVKKGGKVDRRLCGAAWAALHKGYRGNKYEGPSKAEALKKLKAIYKREGWDLPSSK